MKELLDNVSLFWSKYFEDAEVLHSLVEGAVSYISNAKQDTYSYLLSTSIDATPLEIRKENVLIELEDSKFLSVTTIIDSSTQNFIVYDLGSKIEYTNIPYLMASPSSTKFLENNVDFYFFKGDSTSFVDELMAELDSTHYYLLFNKDPRRPGSYELSFRKETEYSIGNFVLHGNTFPTDLPTGTEIEVLDSASTVVQKCRTALKSSSRSILLGISTPVLDASNITHIRVKGENTKYEVSSVETFIYPNNKLQVWVPLVKKDTQLLPEMYSHTHSSIFTESTERYRNFLLGLNSLRTRPMSVENIKSSMCLCANVPVFNSSYGDGDRIIRVDFGDTVTTVFTTIAKYQFPAGLTLDPRIEQDAIEISGGDSPIVRNPDHQQTFFFKELQPLITDIQVNLGIGSDSSWWDRGLDSLNFIEVPDGVMLNEPLDRRVVINHDYPNKIGEVEVNYNSTTYKLPSAAIGDYGLAIGQATRNTIAFKLFNDFLKHHTVFVELSEEFYSLPDFSTEVLSDFRKTLQDSCIPGSLIILGTSIDAILEDLDGDSIPDIIDPVIHIP